MLMKKANEMGPTMKGDSIIPDYKGKETAGHQLGQAVLTHG